MSKSDLSNPSLRFDPDETTYRANFDSDSDSASEAVVWALAEITGRSADELEPIRSVVDPIVFDSLVRRRRRPIQVSFAYNGHEVTVASRGEIIVQPAQSDGGADYAHCFSEDQPPSEAVVEAVAAVKGKDPLELEPIYAQLDSDALDDLVNNSGEEPTLGLHISFQVTGLRVDIFSNRRIVVNSADNT
ncbi:HalOD1 output domain-containing protein [Halorubrum sp. HHNYT27]|uniref:HalOD1 output domain-containing protein n=1 Tax=Halorubrum sp. HHNYT27 TaxID=3402275 RepID=UPI003EBC2613